MTEAQGAPKAPQLGEQPEKQRPRPLPSGQRVLKIRALLSRLLGEDGPNLLSSLGKSKPSETPQQAEEEKGEHEPFVARESALSLQGLLKPELFGDTTKPKVDGTTEVVPEQTAEREALRQHLERESIITGVFEQKVKQIIEIVVNEQTKEALYREPPEQVLKELTSFYQQWITDKTQFFLDPSILPSKFRDIDPNKETSFRESIPGVVPQDPEELKQFQQEIGAKEVSIFMTQFKRLGADALNVDLFERAIDLPQVQSSDTLREYYMVGLNRQKQYEKTIAVGRKYIAEGLKTGEAYGALGKAYRLKYNELYAQASTPEGSIDFNKFKEAQAALQESYNSYLQGYLTEYAYYPGVNAVYALQEMANLERKRAQIDPDQNLREAYLKSAPIKEAQAMRLSRMVLESTRLAGGIHSDDYWCLTTMVELAVSTGNIADAQKVLPRMLLKASKAGLSTTLDTLRGRFKSMEEAGQDAQLIGKFIAEIERRMDSLSDNPTRKAEAYRREGDQYLIHHFDQAIFQDPVFIERYSKIVKSRESLNIKLDEEDAQNSKLSDEDRRIRKEERNVALERSKEGLRYDVAFGMEFESADKKSLTPEERAMRAFIEFRAFNYQEMVQGHSEYTIGGNYKWRGQLHAHTLNREDAKIFSAVLDRLHISSETDFDEFSRKVDVYIRSSFGTRPLEDLNSYEHHIYDNQVKGGKDFLSAGITGDEGLTNVALDLLLGLGDCRQHAAVKEGLNQMYKLRQSMPLFTQLYNEYVATTQPLTNDQLQEQLRRIDEVLSDQLAITDITSVAPIKVTDIYNYPLVNGRVVYDPDIATLPPSQWKPMEDHTLTVRVRKQDGRWIMQTTDTSENGEQQQSPDLYLADSFYQVILPYAHGDSGGLRVPLADLMNPDTPFQVTTVTDTNGVPVPIYFRRAPYAGRRHVGAMGAGLMLLRGHPVTLTTQDFFATQQLDGLPTPLGRGKNAFKQWIGRQNDQSSGVASLTHFYQEEENYMQSGVLGDMYPDYARRRIERDFDPQKKETQNARTERNFMQRQYVELINSANGWDSSVKIADALRDFLIKARSRNPEADVSLRVDPNLTGADADSRQQFVNSLVESDADCVRQLQILKGEIQPEAIDAGKLAVHIAEVRASAQLFLFTPDGSLRFPEGFISERNAKLLTYVASEWHDIFKLLSDRRGQIPPEHEFQMAGFLVYIRDVAKNARKIRVGEEEWILTDQDLNFLIELTGDHETVGKDKSYLAHPTTEIDKAKALFYLLDDFLGVSSENPGHFDIVKLIARFSHTFNSLTNPETRRIFDPSWAEQNLRLFKGIMDMITLQQTWDSAVELGSKDTLTRLRDGAISVLDKIIPTIPTDSGERDVLQQEREKLLTLVDTLTTPPAVAA